MNAYNKICSLWRSWNVKTADQLSHHMHESYVRCIHESNNIDSEWADYDIAREIVSFGTVTNYSGSLLVLTELSNASLCHSLLCKRFEECMPIVAVFIKEVHGTMLAGCYDKHRYVDLEERPGMFKRHDFVVGKDEVGVDPKYVEEELCALCHELLRFQRGDKDSAKILLAGAYFHAKFEVIHPFADGNGRVGRMLLNYWLVLNNHPPITIHYEDREQYFRALQYYVDHEELDELYNFLQVQTVKTWKAFID